MTKTKSQVATILSILISKSWVKFSVWYSFSDSIQGANKYFPKMIIINIPFAYMKYSFSWKELILLLSIIILHNYGNYDITATRLQNVFLVTGSRVVLYGYIRTMKTYMVNQPSYSSIAKCNIFSLTSSSFYPEIIKCHILLSKVFSSEILQIMHISIIR